MQAQPSEKGQRGGFTLMILASPGQKPRRVHVPRWALAALACGWVAVMVGAAWLGFAAGSPPSPQPQATHVALDH